LRYPEADLVADLVADRRATSRLPSPARRYHLRV